MKPDNARSLRSRKIFCFALVVLAVIGLVYVATMIGTPENIAIQALWVIGAAGLFAIGGQSLVDSVMQWRQGTPQQTPNPTTKEGDV